MSIYKTCSFFGHRKIQITNELKMKLYNLVEDLIVKQNVSVFLFGSRSNFDELCHLVVSELKEKYPNIKRIAYTCKNETCILESERKKIEKAYFYIKKQPVRLLGYEEEFEHNTKYTAGKASYIKRNQAMINASDFCVFYYDKNYKPEKIKLSKNSVLYVQPNSGTAISYTYAKKKKKTIINLI